MRQNTPTFHTEAAASGHGRQRRMQALQRRMEALRRKAEQIGLAQDLARLRQVFARAHGASGVTDFSPTTH